MGIGWQALLDELGVDISRAEIIILQDALMERNGGYLHNIPPEGILPATMAA